MFARRFQRSLSRAHSQLPATVSRIPPRRSSAHRRYAIASVTKMLSTRPWQIASTSSCENGRTNDYVRGSIASKVIQLGSEHLADDGVRDEASAHPEDAAARRFACLKRLHRPTGSCEAHGCGEAVLFRVDRNRDEDTTRHQTLTSMRRCQCHLSS